MKRKIEDRLYKWDGSIKTLSTEGERCVMIIWTAFCIVQLELIIQYASCDHKVALVTIIALALAISIWYPNVIFDLFMEEEGDWDGQ